MGNPKWGFYITQTQQLITCTETLFLFFLNIGLCRKYGLAFKIIRKRQYKVETPSIVMAPFLHYRKELPELLSS